MLDARREDHPEPLDVEARGEAVEHLDVAVVAAPRRKVKHPG